MAEDILVQEASAAVQTEAAAEIVSEAAPAAPVIDVATATGSSSSSITAIDGVELTAEEKKIVDSYVDGINITDSQQVLQYGVGAQQKIANFSETALNNVRTKDLGEVGDLLSGVVAELKNFDVTEEKGFLGIFKKGANKANAIKAKYSSAEKNINGIVKAMENHQVTLMKDIAMLDKLYESNLQYYRDLTLYIIAGKEKLKKAREVELPALLAKAEQSGLAEDAQAAKDYASMIDRFEKKVYDLELTRNISMQMGPQIRLIQSNDTVMTEKIQSTLVNTIPLWKSQMVIAIGLEHSQDAAKAQREVTDATNELLKKNAEALKMATIDTAKEAERGIVDIETLTQTNKTLIDTFDEVMKIQQEGRTKRAEAEVELARIENEMRNKVLEISKASM